jgi:4-amino-4-deoxy-L-arabinose transferase-like glycosyltransferase
MSLILVRPTPVEAAPSPSGRTRWHERLRLPARPSADLLVMLGLVLATLVVQGVNIAGYPAAGDDEGTYLAQAWAVQQGHGLAHYTYWYDHPPVGWLQIAALSWIPALLTPEHLAVANARVIMLPFTAAAVALLYTFGRRLALPRWAAALAGAMFALSPLAVTLQRQLFLDNIAVVWILAAFVLALSPRRNLWHHVAAGLCAAVAVLSKETMLIVLPALVLALWQGTHPTTRKFSLVGFVSVLGLVGLTYPLYALLNGELFPGEDHVSLVGGILFQFQREGSGSFLFDGSDSRAIVESWLYYDGVVIVGGLVAAAVALPFLRTLRAPALAVVLLLLMAMRPGYLPAMYVIQALPFLALCLAGVLAAAAGFVLSYRARATGPSRWIRGTVVTAALLAAAVPVVPGWYEGDRVAMTADANALNRAAVDHLAAMPHSDRTRVMVDDALWLDLVHSGYGAGEGAIWFYKLDLDPAIKLDNGWRDLDYVVSTPIVRESSRGLENVDAAMSNSVVVAAFGTGEERVEIRRVVDASS